MYGREELYTIDGAVCTHGKDYLNKAKADKVMDAMEERIKHLESILDLDPRTNLSLVDENQQLRERIKELGEKYKRLLGENQGNFDAMSIAIDGWEKRECELLERIKELEKEIDAGSTGMRMLEEKCKAIETREKEMVEILNSRLAEIRTQEGRIAELEAEVIGYKASLERANFKMCEKDARIKELEECCKWCKGNALPPPPTTEESLDVVKEK